MYGMREAMLRDLSDDDLNELLSSVDVSPFEYHEARSEADRRSERVPVGKTSKPLFIYATNMMTGKDF